VFIAARPLLSWRCPGVEAPLKLVAVNQPDLLPDADSPLPRLDQPLPAALAGRGHGWFTDYRRWPVFSPAWTRGRARSVGLLATGLFVLLIGGAWMSAAPVMPLGGFVQLAITLLVPLFAGPWVCGLARRAALARQLPPGRELLLVAAALAAVIGAVTAFNEWGGEPLKQQVAEWTGMVDESGKRKRIRMEIGVFIRGETAPEMPPPAGPQDSTPSLLSHLSLGVLCALLSGVLALPRLRREREGLRTLAAEEALMRAQQQRREAEMQLSVLAAQVEPHLLFNTLAGVRSAISTDPARAAMLVDRLSAYLRAAIPRLRSDGGAEATLAGQVEIVRAYLALMAARMPRLSYSVELPEALSGLSCPPLMLVSLAENAVKHGAEPKVGPVHVALRAGLDALGRLEVCVEDDGAGFGASEGGSGIGLANIRERLKQMHGPRASLSLQARPEGGVRATLTLPVDPALP
jgi:signal transduction histidine kinase